MIDRLKDPSLFKGRANQVYSDFFKLSKFCTVERPTEGVGFTTDWIEMFRQSNKQDLIEPVITREILGKLFELKDEGFCNMISAMSLYQNHSAKNYIFSEALVRILKRTKTDLSLKYLPESFYGFFDIPGLVDIEGKVIDGVFVNIHKGVLQFSGLVKEVHGKDSYFSQWYFQFPLDRNKTLSEVVGDSFFVSETSPGVSEMLPLSDEKETHQLIANALAYVCNVPLGLELGKNEFKGGWKKIEAQKKNFTQQDFIFVGKDYEGRVFSIDSTAVSGHYRWQPHGPERSLVKLIFIEPHERNYKK